MKTTYNENLQTGELARISMSRIGHRISMSLIAA